MSEASRSVVINPPYTEPERYFEYDDDRGELSVVPGRRLSGFYTVDKNRRREFHEIPLVNMLRPRVKAWREAGYPESTNVTCELLAHWHDRSARENTPFFFCQLEAIETLIYLAETREGQAMRIPDDGGKFERLCTKLCTGGGKTIVMSMLIAWQVCNSRRSRDECYTRNILVVAPNLTVKSRLNVLNPNEPGNYYDRFSVVPEAMRRMLRRANIVICNWHMLDEKQPDSRSVVKKPKRSDESFSRNLVGDMRNILVINDEAHHAYRSKPGDKKPRTREEKEDYRAATVWINGLDRIDSARGIMRCYDFTATPFVPGRGKNETDGLYGWIVSDFSLDDGIESGLVKTPYLPYRDDMPSDPDTGKSAFYHIYKYVKDDLNRPAGEEATLPDLVRNAYEILSEDWKKTSDTWREKGASTPPVMITVANRTETSARIEHSFKAGRMGVPELSGEGDILRIDSKLLEKSPDSDVIREKADTVGQADKIGGQVRNVISVGMLSEGWDARTVTHIMGLRAFTSQLLCEQVVGRGLRRTSYDAVDDGELLPEEHVCVFGIPFAYLLIEEGRPGETRLPKPTLEIRSLPERREYAISWPNVEGMTYTMKQELSLDAESLPELVLDASSTRISAEVAPVVAGKQYLSAVNDLDLERIYALERMQTVIFRTAMSVYDEMKSSTSWQEGGNKMNLCGQIVRLTEEFIDSGKILIRPELFAVNGMRRKILLRMNMDRVIKHIWQGIKSAEHEEVIPLISTSKCESSTEEMISWRTTKEAYDTLKSQINRCVIDSMWEGSMAYHLDHNPNVQAWTKNDHLGFCVRYVFGGITRRYVPDFLVRLTNGRMLVIEVKGVEDDMSRAKHEALCEWVRAVNTAGNYGEWSCEVVHNPAEIDGVIAGGGKIIASH